MASDLSKRSGMSPPACFRCGAVGTMLYSELGRGVMPVVGLVRPPIEEGGQFVVDRRKVRSDRTVPVGSVWCRVCHVGMYVASVAVLDVREVLDDA